MTRTWAYGCLLSLLTCASCDTRNHGVESRARGAAAEFATSQGQPAPSGCGDEKSGAGCGCGAEVRSADATVLERRHPSNGARVSVVGTAIGSAPLVSIAALLNDPSSYQGKTVRVEGDVSAMCHHRRAWFSVQPEGARDGSHIRVLTVPTFLVPPGSVGRKARAEGRVELVEVPASARRHYEAEHGLQHAHGSGAPGRQIVLRAFGAEFI